MTTAIADRQELMSVPAQSNAQSLIEVIDRASRDPSVDISKMERLMEMYDRITSKQAEAEFSRCLADLQLDLPSISKRGTIKNKNGGVQSTYALWEDINDVIKPRLAEHGFALSFRTKTEPGGVTVTGVLSHRMGHRESTEILLPADVSGNKNAVQAVASSVSYGKRYTAGALLNITTHGEDDDAQTAVQAPVVRTIAPLQIARVDRAVASCGPQVQAQFGQDYGDASRIPSDMFDKVINSLESAAIKHQAAKAKKAAEKEQQA